ncbi:L-histidine N(alpha)-methyltransferase [Lentzea sp. NPDC051838]|uniref:L-histidine N(alpha)-methyltransferase n=1 Tax=Lentzea sp. NPDC051838 TaxID=3154849 RepID=UPI0034386420
MSQSAVGKWVDSASKGKLKLALIQDNGKSYIAATTRNRTLIEAMVQERKKYFNGLSLKTISPKREFYELFNPDHVLDIIANLDIRGETLRQYNYFGDGAASWDRYQNRLIEENSPSSPTRTVEQLAMSRSYIDSILAKYKHINVIDVGPGNAFPVKDLLSRLLEQGKLGRYLAIDISADMLAIAERNIKEWFNGAVNFEADIRDITHERFADQLAGAYIGEQADDTINLVLLLGGTLGNLAAPDEALRVIYHSMGRNDLLLYNLKLDTDDNRSLFDFHPETKSVALSPTHSYLFDLLNIDQSYYAVDMGYDPRSRGRFIRAKLKVALSIKFELQAGTRQVDLQKDESILLWHYRHQSADDVIEQFKRNGFNTLQASQTGDHEFLLVICDLAGTSNRR